MASPIKIDSSVYYHDIYWNSYSKVIEYMSENFSGDKSIYWFKHFKEKYCQQKFKCALSFNCGNGWAGCCDRFKFDHFQWLPPSTPLRAIFCRVLGVEGCYLLSFLDCRDLSETRQAA